MKEEEFRKTLKEIKDSAYRRELGLRKEFALSNNTVKIGETVTDHIGSIVVEQIKFSASSLYDTPICVYFGPQLTKAGHPFKDGSKRGVYQSNLEGA